MIVLTYWVKWKLFLIIMYLYRLHTRALRRRHQIPLLHYKGEPQHCQVFSNICVCVIFILLVISIGVNNPWCSLNRSSMTCSTLKAHTNMSSTPAGRVSVWLRGLWRTRWDTFNVHLFYIWQVVYWHSLSFLQLHGSKQHIRALLIDRVMLQHEVTRNNNTSNLNTFHRAFGWILWNLSRK